MVSVNDAYAGNHLNCESLKGKDVKLIIASTDLEEFTDQNGVRKKKIVVFFRGTDKDLVLNKTNATCIAQMYGDQTEAWVGKTITLWPSQAEMGGKTLPAIRIRLLTPVEAGVPGIQQAVEQVKDAFPGAQITSAGEDMGPQENDFGDSDIPF